MPLPSLYVNGHDVEALGMRVEVCRGLRDALNATDPSVTIAGRVGAMRTGLPPVVAPRELALSGKVFESATAARTHTDLLSKFETLKALLATGLVELRTVDLPARAVVARVTRFEFTPVGPDFVATAAEFSLTLTCADPLFYDVAMSTIGFGASRVSVPLGTGPSGGIIRIMGPATNPVVTYRDLTGTAVHTLGFTRTLAATDYEEIDFDLLTVRRVQSGAATNDVAALSSGDIEAFVLSPEDGDALAGVWPTLECSGLTGAGNCELQYWRAWI